MTRRSLDIYLGNKTMTWQIAHINSDNDSEIVHIDSEKDSDIAHIDSDIN